MHPYPVAPDPAPAPLPLLGRQVPAGFPSPADDYLEGEIDLNRYLIERPAACYVMRVSGWSMSGAGIMHGDLVVVPPAYSSLRHRLAVRGPRGGGGWRRTLGGAGVRRGAPHEVAEAGPRPRRGGACRRAASGRPCCGCCGARTWSWSRASSG